MTFFYMGNASLVNQGKMASQPLAKGLEGDAEAIALDSGNGFNRRVPQEGPSHRRTTSRKPAMIIQNCASGRKLEGT